MPQPRNDGGFGTVLDRNSLHPGYGAATHRSGMNNHGTGQSTGEISVSGVKGEECHQSTVEIFDVFGLGFVPASSIRIFAFGVSLGGPLRFKFGTDFIDGRCRCPNAP
jgi:hypothetical protein